MFNHYDCDCCSPYEEDSYKKQDWYIKCQEDTKKLEKNTVNASIFLFDPDNPFTKKRKAKLDEIVNNLIESGLVKPRKINNLS